jgi:large subunit ribosomal protein L28
MAQKCDICGKVPSHGNKVSHSHRKTRRMWGTNVQTFRLRQPNGAVKRQNVCTKCLKGNKVVKA